MPRPGRSGSWHASSGIPSHQETLKAKILRLCESRPGFHAYFLMWDHAYFYVLERESWQARTWEELHPRLHFIFDNRHPFGGSHHEKLCLIDGEVAFCGGIDLCDERWDTPAHLYSDARRSLDGKAEKHGPYHDLAIEVRGPVCGEIHKHVARRWRTMSEIPFPPAPEPPAVSPAAALPVLVSRTIPSLDPALGREPIVREVEFLFRDLIRSARKRIIIEGQYYWSKLLNDLLIAQMHRRRGQGFEVFLILAELSTIKSPSRRMTAYQNGLIELLERAAEATGTRFIRGTPFVDPEPGEPGAPPKPVYIHSKVLIIDDRTLSVGSANFATRALRLDTELNLTLLGATPGIRRRIDRFSQELLRHWNLEHLHGPGRARIRLVPPPSPPRHRLPWELFFDPVLPWSYRGKRRFRVLLGREHPAAVALSVLCLAGSLLCAAALAQGALGLSVTGRDWLTLSLLTLAWWFPIATFPVLLLTGWFEGFEAASRWMLASLWAGSLFSYATGRLFPSWAEQRVARRRGAPPPDLRDFRQLIALALDPRISLRAKFAAQGFHSVSFPWFALVTWLILPALLQAVLRLTIAVTPGSVIEFTRDALRPWPAYGLVLAATALLPGALRATFEKRDRRQTRGAAPEGIPERADEKRTAENPLLQHPQGIQREQQAFHPEIRAQPPPQDASGPGLPAGGSRSA
ncbi:MAG: phospholipase D-like domain-containing protein [Oligoflexia bacterium]|nr:phospholipase D-like domain-containing protein [Oligoflexia bacterium]